MKTEKEESNQLEQTPNELDLISLISVFWHWCIKYLWRPFLEVVRMCVRRWYVFLVAILLGLGVSYLQSQVYEAEYYASMLVRINSASASDYVNKMMVLGKQSSTSWKDELNLSEKAANDLIAIWPHYVRYKQNHETDYFVDYSDDYLFDTGTEIVNYMFAIEIKTKSEDFFEEYTQAFVEYLLKDEYLSHLHKEQIQKSESQLEFLKQEIVNVNKLRNTKRVISALSGSYGLRADSTYINQSEVLAYHNLLYTLNKQVADLDYYLSHKDIAVEIVSPMKEIGSSIKDWSYYRSRDVVAFLALAFLLTFIIDFRKELVAFSKKHLS